jgi:isoleucyl-tRNA synthetase
MTSEQVKQLIQNGKFILHASMPVEIFIEDMEITTESKPGFSVKKEGEDIVALDISFTPALISEGHARELVHHIQNLRKEAGLEVSDRIRIAYRGDPDLESAIDEHREYIRSETLAVSLEGNLERDGQPAEINGKPITIAINKSNP